MSFDMYLGLAFGFIVGFVCCGIILNDYWSNR